MFPFIQVTVTLKTGEVVRSKRRRTTQKKYREIVKFLSLYELDTLTIDLPDGTVRAFKGREINDIVVERL